MKPKRSKSPIEIVLAPAERIVLEDVARAMVMPHRDVVRAQVILMVADGTPLAVISRKVGRARRIVRKWAAAWLLVAVTVIVGVAVIEPVIVIALVNGNDTVGVIDTVDD